MRFSKSSRKIQKLLGFYRKIKFEASKSSTTNQMAINIV